MSIMLKFLPLLLKIISFFLIWQFNCISFVYIEVDICISTKINILCEWREYLNILCFIRNLLIICLKCLNYFSSIFKYQYYFKFLYRQLLVSRKMIIFVFFCKTNSMSKFSLQLVFLIKILL